METKGVEKSFLSALDHNDSIVEVKDFSNGIIFFISLTCSYCIELLPHLSKIEREIAPRKMILMSTGSSEENRELLTYFEWDFKVLQLDKKSEKLFGVKKFPSVLFTAKSSNEIIHNSIVYDYEHFNFLDKEASNAGSIDL